MIENGVWSVITRKDVLKGAKIIANTWTMKKIANGT
jgi:hypothetical protein